MVVTCPQCSKRYMLDDALLPQTGRQVRCVACHHVWKQVPEVDLYTHNPLILNVPDPSLQVSVSSQRRFAWVGWVMFITVLLSWITALIFGRNFIVSYWPVSEKYYELAGLPITIPGSGISITNASSQIYHDGPTEMVRVMGSVVNTSDRVRPIPPLKIILMGNDKGEKNPLAQWEHRLSAQSLLPGEKILFKTDPRPKVDGTHHVRVEF